MTEGSAPHNGTALEPPQGSALSRVFRVFVKPGEVFRELDRSPTWIWAFVVLIVVSLASQLVVMPRLDMERTIREQVAARGGQQPTEQQIETQVEVAKKFTRFQVFVVPAVSAVAFLILGALYFLGLKAVGSQADFKHTFATVVHAYLPPAVVGAAVTALVAVQRGSFTGAELQRLVKSNLAAFLSPDAPKALLAAAGVIDIFNIWLWVLLAIGLSIVGHVKQSKAVTVVAALWIGWIVVKVGLAFIGSAF